MVAIFIVDSTLIGGMKLKTLNLDKLNIGLPTITPVFCKMLVEAAVFCLEHNQHQSGKCILYCAEDINDLIMLDWTKNDPRVIDTYGDLQEVTEYGATGMAVLLAVENTAYTTVSRSFKEFGFDYWIGDKDDLSSSFQRKARLEISGILKGNDSIFKSRIKQKMAQTDKSDSMNLDCYVSVIDFASPKASLVRKGV